MLPSRGIWRSELRPKFIQSKKGLAISPGTPKGSWGSFMAVDPRDPIYLLPFFGIFMGMVFPMAAGPGIFL